MKLSELASQLQLEMRGDDCEIDRVGDLSNANTTTLAFVYNAKYLDFIQESKAAAIIISEDWQDRCNKPILLSSNPRLDFARAASLLHPVTRYPAGVDATAVVHESVVLPASLYIGPGVVIEANVVLGEDVQIGANTFLGRSVTVGCNTFLHPNVTVEHDCIIGDDCEIFSGTVIGSDGFGYVMEGGSYMKVPQLGRVVIGNNVDIGANTTIDRGALNDTRIHDGVKLDNHIQVAHNVVIGQNTIISGLTGIAGSTRIGANCMIGGGVGIRDNLTITDNVVITGRSFVSSSIEQPGSYSSSVLIDSTRNWKRNVTRFKQLDELARTVKKLESALVEKTSTEDKNKTG